MKNQTSTTATQAQPANDWMGVWAFGDRCDVQNSANPKQGENVMRMLVDDKANFAIQDRNETPRPVTMIEALDWLGTELTERNGTIHDEEFCPAAVGFVLFRIADALEGKVLPKIEGRDLELPVHVVNQLKAQAVYRGVSNEQVIEQALTEFVERHGTKEMAKLDLPADLNEWAGAQAKKAGLSISEWLEGVMRAEMKA